MVLGPVKALEGGTLPDALVSFLAPARVVVLSYHVLPEQTPTEQASMQFEKRARAAVDDIAAVFAGGGDPETRVVFTHDHEQTIEWVAAEVNATAILLPNPTGAVSDVRVPIRGAVDDDRLVDLVATLAAGAHERVAPWRVTAGLGASAPRPPSPTPPPGAERAGSSRHSSPPRRRSATSSSAPPTPTWW